MVTSPKTGRELEGTRVYKGPPSLARFVRKYVGPSRSDDRDDASE